MMLRRAFWSLREPFSSPPRPILRPGRLEVMGGGSPHPSSRESWTRRNRVAGAATAAGGAGSSRYFAFYLTRLRYVLVGHLPMGSHIEELASFVDQYRGARVPNAKKHVRSWLQAFDEPDRVGDELAQVLRSSFLTREQAASELGDWLTNPKKVSKGLINSWDEATFLDIAERGGSQRDVLDLLDEEAAAKGEEPIRSRSGDRVFVYADDVSVHGMRILNDLTSWATHDAPAEFDLLILLEWELAGQETYVTNELKTRARRAGRTGRIRWWCNEQFTRADCYSPSELPDNEELVAWREEMGVEEIALRTGTATGRFFSSDESRRRIESEFLIAGAKILANNRHLNPRKYMRPLGNAIWRNAPLGLGVPIVTWRNCPNSAPLALWAEGIGTPLFPRQSN
jgi:hypothetical protein